MGLLLQLTKSISTPMFSTGLVPTTWNNLSCVALISMASSQMIRLSTLETLFVNILPHTTIGH